MKKVLLPLILLFSLNSINSQENYKSLLIEYMTAQGQFETFNATIDQMGTMMGVTIKDEDREEFTNDVMGSLIELLVPVYQKHFTVEDLKNAKSVAYITSGIGSITAIIVLLVTLNSNRVQLERINKLEAVRDSYENTK